MSTDPVSGHSAAFVRVLMPTAAPTVILALGRWWHAQGAAHSFGDAALMMSLAAGTAVYGGVCAREGNTGAVPAYCAAVSGGLAAAAIAGYASGMALPLIMWAAATLITAVCGIRSRGADARAHAAHLRGLEVERVRGEFEIEREAIRAQSRIEVAQITGAWRVRAAALTSPAPATYRVEQIAPELLALSAEARTALASPTARLALEPRRTSTPDVDDNTPDFGQLDPYAHVTAGGAS